MSQTHREVLLTGTVPLKPASKVFETVAEHLGGIAPRIPDGEQLGWIRAVWDSLDRNPVLAAQGNVRDDRRSARVASRSGKALKPRLGAIAAACALRVTAVVGLSVATLLVAPGVSMAQTWPAKPVRIICPTGPGLQTDLLARLLADGLSKEVGAQFFVENIAGAGTSIGARAAAASPADGYTFLVATTGTLVNNLFLYKSLPYDPFRDFTPVGSINEVSTFLVSVNADLPVRTVRELIALAKAQPGKLSYAVDSSSGYAQLIGKWIQKLAGVRMEEIPYKSTAQAVQDTATGRTQLMISSVTSVDAFVKAGKLRRLATTSKQRFQGAPDVESLSETFPDLYVEGGTFLVAPAATPAAIVQRLNAHMDKTVKSAPYQQKLESFGLGISGAGSPAAIARMLRNDRERWAKIYAELDIQPQ